MKKSPPHEQGEACYYKVCGLDLHNKDFSQTIDCWFSTHLFHFWIQLKFFIVTKRVAKDMLRPTST